MNMLSIVLFLHVVGMLGLFAALGVDGVAVFRLRRSRSDEAMTPWIRLSAGLPRVYQASIALVVLSGAYLTRGVVQGMTSDTPASDLGWLAVSVASLAAFGVTGALSIRRLRPSWRAMAATHGIAPQLLPSLQEPLLTVLVVLRVALAIAIVFLMMNRPSLDVSLLVMAVAVVAGLASSGIVWRRRQVATAAGGV